MRAMSITPKSESPYTEAILAKLTNSGLLYLRGARFLYDSGISLTDKTTLRDLFDKSNFENASVLCDSSEPNLFNFYPVHF